MMQPIATPIGDPPHRTAATEVSPSLSVPKWRLMLAAWVDAGALRPLDLALTRFIAERGPEQDEAVLLAVALTSERNGHGHVCLDLAAALAVPDAVLGRLRDDSETSPGVRQQLRERLHAIGRVADWAERLAASACISDRRGDAGQGAGAGAGAGDGKDIGASIGKSTEQGTDDEASPLVLAGSVEQPLLYLRRYWHYEQRIRWGLEERLRQPCQVDVGTLRKQIDTLFKPSTGPDWQRMACALATRQTFFIITGGPGTGKTTTVVRLLAVLQALVPKGQSPLRIELAAPTGKAAARLNESITAQLSDLSEAFSRPDAQPTRVKTLHRLLGTIPGSRHFRHHGAHPLPADVVVVDEASMVDVEMMASLLDAMRPDARLILLGDKDQLSSVEAGAVLGDLCGRAAHMHYTRETAAWLKNAAGQSIPKEGIDAHGSARDQAIVMLRKSYRFSAEGGIGALAALVNQSDVVADGAADVRDGRFQAVQQLFAREQAKEADTALGAIQSLPLGTPEAASLVDLVCSGYGGAGTYLDVMQRQRPQVGAEPSALDAWAAEVLKAQKSFQLLAALRSGPWGVEGLNQLILRTLRAADLLGGQDGVRSFATSQWFPGRPVLVTRNDYGLNLMNGDIGVTLAVPRSDDPDSAGSRRDMLRVAFPDIDGGVRWILPSRLQVIETVFAMTVHKSQGSEFTHTALVLPDQSNPVLTRELLYTAITRAKERFTLLYGSESVLAEALERRVERVSGLYKS